MDCVKDVIIPIVIPIFSALIGGLLTLWGVVLTIKNQDERIKEEKRLSIKPYFYASHPYQVDPRLGTAATYYILSPDGKREGKLISGIIENTDNAVFILKNVRIGSEYYYPKHGKVIDKNKIFHLNIYAKEVSEDICLTVTDVMENEYYYKITYEKKSEKNYQIESVEELQSDKL